jgi:hypothetical protein
MRGWIALSVALLMVEGLVIALLTVITGSDDRLHDVW